MKTKTKPTPRARKMWGNYYGEFVACHDTRSSAQTGADAGMPALIAIPVAVIPLNDVPALVRTAGDAFAASYDGHLCKSDIVAMLTAIGVLPRTRKGGRK